MQLLPTKSLYYDDVNLIAQPQPFISSRAEVIPALHKVIVAPMESVVGKEFAIEAVRLGLSVCLHRFESVETQLDIYKSLNFQSNNNKAWIAVGLNDWHRVDKILKEVQNPHLLVEVANGYLKGVVDFTKKLYEMGCSTMVGNVHSGDGIKQYQDAGIKDCLIRVGIGGGSVCKTSVVTGFTRGSITELAECVHIANSDQYCGISVVADGGIRASGEAIKAFGAGAHYVMMGGYFSKANEAQNAIEGTFKYWGGASAYQQERLHKKPNHVEGVVKQNDKEDYGSLEFLVKKLWDGISSGVSYSGYPTLEGFIGNGTFEEKAR